MVESINIPELEKGLGANLCKVSTGAFPYQLNINLHGLITYSPIFKKKSNPKAFNPLERLKKETWQPTTVARDQDGYRIFAEIKNGKIVSGRTLAQKTKKNYDRKNKISENGTWLKGRAINKIKNSILHKYYASGGDYTNDLKFFTYTIQAQRYFQIKQQYQENKKLIDRERNLDFRNDYRPFAPVSLLNQLEKENLNPDQFFIKIFSEYLENLKKRKFQKIYSYVWVAEKTKQGVLHFHCIFDTPYLCAVGESRSWSYKCGMENFSNSVQFGIDRKGGKIESKYQNLNPEGISAYLTKYVSKNQSLIFGRNYAMSKCFFKASKKGVQKFFNPVFVYNNPKEKKGNFIIDPPWYSYDSETNRYYKRKIYLPVDVLNENSIELPSGAKIPIFTLVCKKKEKLLKLIFPDLYYRSSHLFDKPEIEQGEMALAY